VAVAVELTAKAQQSSSFPSQWVLYYTYSRPLNVLWIRTVWYARRGRPPSILRSR
jgi:hypothetical protein